MEPWGADEGSRRGYINTHLDTLEKTQIPRWYSGNSVPGRPPQILGKNLESFLFFNPMEASTESGWKPDMKKHYPQDPQGGGSRTHQLISKSLLTPRYICQRHRIYSLLLCNTTPKAQWVIKTTIFSQELPMGCSLFLVHHHQVTI